MAKAIQCPTCGRKHPVASVPDAPTFRCDGCGQSLKVPAQFRPSAKAASQRARRSSPSAVPEPTAALPARGVAAAAAPAPAPARAPRPARVTAAAKPDRAPSPVDLRWRALAWAVALPLALIVTVWLARVTGWLGGDQLVDTFTGTGFTRYARVLSIAPIWALFTALFVTLFLEGGRALARRRAATRASWGGAPRSSRRRFRRRQPESLDAAGAPDRGDGHDRGGVEESSRTAARRGSP